MIWSDLQEEKEGDDPEIVLFLLLSLISIVDDNATDTFKIVTPFKKHRIKVIQSLSNNSHVIGPWP